MGWLSIDWSSILKKPAFRKAFEDYYESQFEEAQILYNARRQGRMPIHKVFQVTAEGEAYLEKIIKDKGWRKLDNDVKVLKIADHVNRRMTYKNDSENYGKVEYWADPYTIYKSKVDDCDGYAVLICYLCWKSGVPKSRLKLVAGNVFPEGGHAYILYAKETTGLYHTVEGSFYARRARERFVRDIPHSEAKEYGSRWWYTTDEKSYSRIGDFRIKKGLGVT